MSNNSTRGTGPTPANPQAPSWGGQPRPTINPKPLDGSPAIINNPGAQPSPSKR